MKEAFFCFMASRIKWTMLTKTHNICQEDNLVNSQLLSSTSLKNIDYLSCVFGLEVYKFLFFYYFRMVEVEG